MSLLTRLLGAFLILSVLWRHTPHGATLRPSRRSFAPIGALFGFLSALLGSVGPLLAPFFLAYGLVEGAYIGTEAAATAVMHVTKIVAYTGTAVLTASAAGVGLALAPVMVAGSWAGKQVLDRLPERVFVAIIEAVLLVAGLTFVIGG